MSTHCHIGIKNGDHVRYIYCHFDGYPSYVGKILLNHYNTVEKVNELIDGGDLSSLGEVTKTDLPHSWVNPVEGVCVYYERDRGETDMSAKMCCLTEYKDSDVDYQYLFDTDTNKWTIETNFTVFNELTPRICE